RLARAVRPDQTRDAARRHFERRVVDREQSAELHRHADDFEQSRHHAPPMGSGSGTSLLIPSVRSISTTPDSLNARSRPSSPTSGSALAAINSSYSFFASLRHGSSRANPSPIGTTAPDGFWMMPRTARPGAR